MHRASGQWEKSTIGNCYMNDAVLYRTSTRVVGTHLWAHANNYHLQIASLPIHVGVSSFDSVPAPGTR